MKKGQYTHVLAAHSAFGKSLMPRVAAALDAQQISDITDIKSEDSKPLGAAYRQLLTMQPSSARSMRGTPS